MYILKHYFKSKNKTDYNDFTKFVIKIGPVPDLQELPNNNGPEFTQWQWS